MANIKKLQMWDHICADTRISVSKSMLGLSTTATYVPTHSIIDAKTIEYSPATGERLKTILGTPAEGLARAIEGFRPEPTVNGNYMLEACASRDGAFVALMLLQFQQMSYEPVTGVLVYEGDAARIAGQLL